MTWYIARAGGMTALVLLTISVCLGLALSLRVQSGRWPRFAIEDVHRFAGVLTGAFIAIHGASLLIDGYLPFSLRDLIVPGVAPYRPLWTTLGVVSAELLAALAVANHFRARFSYRFWRRTHHLNFAVWAGAVVHGLTSGTDTGAAWAVALYFACVGSVALLVCARLWPPPGNQARIETAVSSGQPTTSSRQAA
jgi:predicted ferric reductase